MLKISARSVEKEKSYARKRVAKRVYASSSSPSSPPNIRSSSIRRQNSGAPGMKIADETLLTLQFNASITRIGFWERVPVFRNYTNHGDLEKFRMMSHGREICRSALCWPIGFKLGTGVR